MIALALTVIPLSPPVSALPLNSWSSTTSYPSGIAQQSCVTNSGFIYCVGGNSPSPTDAVFFAPVSSSGVGPWISTNPYPAPIAEESCVTNAGFIYCVGGEATDIVSFAPVSSSGVGTWTTSITSPLTTNPYPVPIERESCVTNSGLIYCVGGNSPSPTSAVFFAPITSSGVGPWTSTTSYPFPITSQSCVARTSSVYCVGGSSSPFNTLTSDVFVASINGPAHQSSMGQHIEDLRIGIGCRLVCLSSALRA